MPKIENLLSGIMILTITLAVTSCSKNEGSSYTRTTTSSSTSRNDFGYSFPCYPSKMVKGKEEQVNPYHELFELDKNNSSRDKMNTFFKSLEDHSKIISSSFLCINKDGKSINAATISKRLAYFRNFYTLYQDLLKKTFFKGTSELISNAKLHYKATHDSVPLLDWKDKLDELKVIFLGENHTKFVHSVNELYTIIYLSSLQENASKILVLQEGLNYKGKDKSHGSLKLIDNIVFDIFFRYMKEKQDSKGVYNPVVWDVLQAAFMLQDWNHNGNMIGGFAEFIHEFVITSENLKSKISVLEGNYWDLPGLNLVSRNRNMVQIINDNLSDFDYIVVIAGDNHLPSSEIESYVNDSSRISICKMYVDLYSKYPTSLDFNLLKRGTPIGDDFFAMSADLFSNEMSLTPKNISDQFFDNKATCSTYPILKYLTEEDISYSILHAN